MILKKESRYGLNKNEVFSLSLTCLPESYLPTAEANVVMIYSCHSSLDGPATQLVAGWLYWIPSNMEISTTLLHWDKHVAPSTDMHFMFTTFPLLSTFCELKEWLTLCSSILPKVAFVKEFISYQSVRIGSCL